MAELKKEDRVDKLLRIIIGSKLHERAKKDGSVQYGESYGAMELANQIDSVFPTEDALKDRIEVLEGDNKVLQKKVYRNFSDHSKGTWEEAYIELGFSFEKLCRVVQEIRDLTGKADRLHKIEIFDSQYQAERKRSEEQITSLTSQRDLLRKALENIGFCEIDYIEAQQALKEGENNN